MRSMITELFEDGRTIFRAHVWTEQGYSTKTHGTISEARAWIASKEPRLETL